MGPSLTWGDIFSDSPPTSKKKGGTLKLTGNVITGQHNIAIGHSVAAPATHTVFTEESSEWMRWCHNENKAEIKLSNYWYVIDPKPLNEKHPLDMGPAIITEGKEDLEAIRDQYEKHIASSPWLQKLRRDYDALEEKHKLFDAIRGSDDDA